MKHFRMLALYLSLALVACASPNANRPAPAAKAVRIGALPAQLAVNQQIELSAEVVNEDGSTSSDVLWAFLDDSPSDAELEAPLSLIWQASVTPLKYHFSTNKAVYLSNRLTGRNPGTMTLVAASRVNPQVRSKTVMQIVPAP